MDEIREIIESYLEDAYYVHYALCRMEGDSPRLSAIESMETLITALEQIIEE